MKRFNSRALRNILPVLTLWVFAGAGCQTTSHDVAPLHGSSGEVVAVVFTSVDCPVANAMAPQLRSVFKDAEARGVRCYLVYPRSGMTEGAMSEHAHAYGLEVATLADPDHAMVDALDAGITPEAYVLEFSETDDWRIRYRGRVNDLYASIGNRRDLPAHKDFHEAIVAVVAGEPVKSPYSAAVGCTIERSN